MKRNVLSGVSVFAILLGSALLALPEQIEAQAITMKLQQTCGVPTDRLRVLIRYPPGGCESVDSNGTVTVTVPVGTNLLVVSVVESDPLERAPLVGVWTPAANEGTLPVICRDH